MTPQAVSRFVSRFGDRVAVLHSRLGAGERRDEWHRLRDGEARICVGPRSAIFAPIAGLGLIVVDEEHDASYKQEGDPRYDAREVARRRAAERGRGAGARLGDPAARELARARADRAARAASTAARCPRSRCSTCAAATAARGRCTRAPATALGAPARARRQGDRADQPPRLGAAPRPAAPAAGPRSCPSCDVSLVVHRAGEGLRCHHCGHAERLPAACPDCGSVTLARAGAGSQRIEDEIAARRRAAGRSFASTPTPRARAGGHLEILAALPGGRAAGVLVGTQMVAKGHDFPDVVLGVVIDADSTLRFPDLRAEERTFALVAQLAGRSGRGERGGRVLVQTLAPEAEAIAHAARHDAAGFLAGELERRRELGYPPFAHLIRIELSRSRRRAARRRAADRLRAALDAALPEGAVALGPAPRFRLRDRERRQILIKAPERAARGRRRPRDRARRGPRRARCAGSRSRSTSTLSRAVINSRSMSEVTEEQLEDDLRGRASPEEDGGALRARARAPRGRARRGGRLRRSGAALARLRDHRVRPRARGRGASGWWRSCATRWASASPRPSSASCGACSSSRPARTRPRPRSSTRRSSGSRTSSRPPRRAVSACPGSASTSSAPLHARVARRGRGRRAAAARGLGARGPGAPARDRPPRRRPDPRPHASASSARARCGRCARAPATAPSPSPIPSPSPTTGEGRLPRHLGLRRGDPSAARRRPSTAPALVVTPPDRRAGPRPQARPGARRGGGRGARDRGAANRGDRGAGGAGGGSGPPNPSSASSAPSASCCASRCSPSSSCSTCTRRCCRAGAARRRSSARSWPATSAPGSRSCGSPRGSTRARSRCSEAVAIGDDDFGRLSQRLEELGGRLLVEALERRERAASSSSIAQDDAAATYAEKIEPEERRLDPERPAIELERRVRALTPHIGAYLELAGGERLGVLEARAEDGELGAGDARRRPAACASAAPRGCCDWCGCARPAAARWTPTRTCAAISRRCRPRARERRGHAGAAGRVRGPAAHVRGRRLDRPRLHRRRAAAPSSTAASSPRRGGSPTARSSGAATSRPPDRRARRPPRRQDRRRGARGAAARALRAAVLRDGRPRRGRPGGRAGEAGDAALGRRRTPAPAPQPGS